MARLSLFCGVDMNSRDQEVTLGTGRLLALFFGLVIVCALFFSMGYSMGRKSNADTVLAAVTGPTHSSSGGGKSSPTAAETGVKSDCAASGTCPPDNTARPSSDEMTFYKAVEQNEPNSKLEVAPKPSAQVTTRTVESKPLSPGLGYMVQVAAVSKQDDADALVNALRKKHYPVLATSGAVDRFYHVQVGPFPDVKEAESMRSKLIGDGYNPILKK